MLFVVVEKLGNFPIENKITLTKLWKNKGNSMNCDRHSNVSRAKWRVLNKNQLVRIRWQQNEVTYEISKKSIKSDV